MLVVVSLLIFLFKYKQRNVFDIVLVSIIASSLTLPYFWFIFPVYIVDRRILIIFSECLIFIVEAFMYWRLLKIKFAEALIISGAANLSSIVLGYLLKLF